MSVPNRHYLDTVAADTERKAALAVPITSPHTGAPADVAAHVRGALARLRPELLALSHRIFEHAVLRGLDKLDQRVGALRTSAL